MSVLSRRTFLAGAAGVGLAFAQAPSASAARILTTRESHRVVVIGSGFGGGIAALRLARAGVPVTVLERGIRWPAAPNVDTFPHTNPDLRSLDHRLSWLGSPTFLPIPLPQRRYTGLLERVQGDHMAIMCAAGVGGGSLVYQGMSLQPTAEVFHSTFPEELDYERLDRVHYPRVARMLHLATAPDELIDTPNYTAARVFASRARANGYAVSKVPMPIDWNYALAELRGEMKPSYTNGDCAMGVNNGGKYSVDVTYIKKAERTGRVQVLTLHQVTDVAQARDGRWEIHVERIDTEGRVQERKILTARTLIMAAGSANTTKLLMRAAHHGAIRDLPDKLGTNWGSNADRIYMWTDLQDRFGSPQGGPVIYASKAWDDPATANTVIQASLPPVPGNNRATMLVGYGVSSGRGRFVWDSRRDEAVLRWPKEADAGIQQHIHERVTNIAGGASFLLDTTGMDATTWHPLGGASMNEVCDLEGRVFGHRGLYVLDGALMPGTTAACNPSLTIAAVAERAMDHIVAKDVGTII
ncbi:GMC oxidoreductase [Sporichthya polymorpha]|uniref:GMC oxidoreductase n=1 Tax=Sporichthya polymorpha TaxID=35751 RepID=UPI000379116B|nr:GMC oxidoreductase [Sporichthya polymorpha]